MGAMPRQGLTYRTALARALGIMAYTFFPRFTIPSEQRKQQAA